MATTQPPVDPGRQLLDDLETLEGAGEGRLRLELLNHLVATALEENRPLPQHLLFTALHFGVPASARLLARLIEAIDPATRAEQASHWLGEISQAGEAAKATVITVVAAHLEDREPAHLTAMELTSESLWIASLVALDRGIEARATARGELLARIRALADDHRPASPARSSDDAWWRAIAVAGSLTDAVGAPTAADRAEAVAALVAIRDGAWHLLVTRHRPVLGPVIDAADRTGDAYLAALGQRSVTTDVDRHRRLLDALGADQRAAVAEELTHTLMAVAAIGAPPPGPVEPPSAATSPGEAAQPPVPSEDEAPSADDSRGVAPYPAEDEPSAAEGGARPARRLRGIPRAMRRRVGRRRTPPGHRGETRRARRQAARAPTTSARRRPGLVSTGFADADDPGSALDPRRPLRRGQPCVFWLEVGPEPVPGSIEAEHVALPAGLPARARLTVALFAFGGELELRGSATTGVIELAEDGTALVVHQPGGGTTSAGERRLCFDVVAPDVDGPARLRCSIYHHGVLVQSRVVTALVGGGDVREPDEPPALRSVVDYRLFRALEPASLQSLSEHRASLLLNDDGAGTHGLRFAAVEGGDVITRDVSISEGAIADQIRMARHALRRVSWGDEEEWSADRDYRYAQGVDEARLTADLVTLAANGARFFQLLVEEVAGSDPAQGAAFDPYLARDRISQVLRCPGRVQIALQRSPSHILPAALIYDHWLTDSAAAEDYRLCPEFVRALRSGTPLEQSACLQGDCPQARHGAELTIVCPSGFWGFRHELGFPVTHGERIDATERIVVRGTPAVSVAVSTELSSHRTHVEVLRGLVAGDDQRWRLADTRDEFLADLRLDDRQVVYLYCHGGVTNNVPYVRLGETGARPITRLDLANERVRWESSRPLVILNGCHTTALDPETAIDFVRFFVRTALASGVIGTEITVFEELGQIFGQAFMQRFLSPGTTVGAAVRGARLDLLQAGNPLGLVYIPFALAGLQLDGTVTTPESGT